jgi:tubulin polyglutamylase TTLL9
MPLTFNLPSEYPIFLEEYKKTSKDKYIWIMKPIGKSQGKGIFLFTKISDISEWAETATAPEPYIVQRYINDPLLIGNKKFDLRIYVLVVSHNPLTIYLYRSGFARFTHYRYEKSDINSLCTPHCMQRVT